MRNHYALLLLLVLLPLSGWAQPYTETEGRAAWAKLQRQPITETTFRKSCDLIQDIGQTNLKLAYELLAQYVPKVRATRNQQWLHVLLINWGKGYESLGRFAEAEPIFRQARDNSRSVPRLYGQAITYTAQLYVDWDKPDSLARYVALGEQVARAANDRETEAFMRIFRALSRQRQGQIAAMRRDFDEAIRLATPLPDKNALFMAWFNRTNKCFPNPNDQIAAYDSLLTLTNDSTLIRKPRFYERTTVYFRNPRPTILYILVQLNLLMTDYENAGKFADMVYDALVRPNPNGPLAPYLNAEMSFVRSYQGQFGKARAFLDTSRRQFAVAENQIPYTSYFLAAGLLAEHDGQLAKAANYYRQSLTKGITSGAFSRFPPELFYARTLVRLGQYANVQQLLTLFDKDVAANRYTAVGLYYYETVANLRKAQGNIGEYGQALDMYHTIRDSLTNLNQYRAVQQIMARVRIRDKEQQIERLNAENAARTIQIRRERRFYWAILALALLTIGLLVLYFRNRQIRARQREQLQQNQLVQFEQNRKMELLQGVMQAEENERRKIADQLHDEVNAMLALASLNVSSVLEKGPQDSQSGPKLAKTQAALLSVSATVRGISHRLTPLLIEQYGFRRAIDDLAESINVSGRLRLETNVVGFDDPGQASLAFLNELYRIIQELVHNILKHAQATEASVEVVENGPFVTLMVEDNGVGMAPNNQTDGMGLRTIRSKVAYLGGVMEIQPKPDGGTLVVIDQLRLPEQISTTMHTIN